MKTIAYGALSPTTPIEKIEIERRTLTDNDVAIKISYCGICHSDIHTAKGDWGEVHYPCVPGHEIIGKVIEVGKNVTSHNIGDTVGVGCMVNACRECENCKSNDENYCSNTIYTYSSTDVDSTDTKGGYSSHIIVDKDFVIPIPENMSEAETAPLLCAGITMYSPLKHWNTTTNSKVAIIGVGGLGHMGIKIAKAMGAEITAITSSPNKSEIAIEYGADNVLISTDEQQMNKYNSYFDLIINTIPGKHDLDPYINLLRINGSIVLVGPIAINLEFGASNLLAERKSVAGSGIGSISETIEMLDFCNEHNIYPNIDIISPDNINTAWESMINKQMDHRYVISMED